MLSSFRSTQRTLLAILCFLAGFIQVNIVHAKHSPKSLQSAVKTHLGVFLVKPKLRDPDSGITMQGGVLRIAMRKEVTTAQRPASLCKWTRWLLTGRLENTAGARALFRALNDIERIELEVYSVETRVEPTREQHYRQIRRLVPEASLMITKERALRLDRNALRRNLTGRQCNRLVRRVLDRAWLRGDT